MLFLVWFPIPLGHVARGRTYHRADLPGIMVKTTIIARVSDGLPLAASMDDEQVIARHLYGT